MLNTEHQLKNWPFKLRVKHEKKKLLGQEQHLLETIVLTSSANEEPEARPLPLFIATDPSIPNQCTNCGCNETAGCWRRGWAIDADSLAWANLCNKCGLRYKKLLVPFNQAPYPPDIQMNPTIISAEHSVLPHPSPPSSGPILSLQWKCNSTESTSTISTKAAAADRHSSPFLSSFPGESVSQMSSEAAADIKQCIMPHSSRDIIWTIQNRMPCRVQSESRLPSLLGKRGLVTCEIADEHHHSQSPEESTKFQALQHTSHQAFDSKHALDSNMDLGTTSSAELTAHINSNHISPATSSPCPPASPPRVFQTSSSGQGPSHPEVKVPMETQTPTLIQSVNKGQSVNQGAFVGGVLRRLQEASSHPHKLSTSGHLTQPSLLHDFQATGRTQAVVAHKVRRPRRQGLQHTEPDNRASVAAAALLAMNTKASSVLPSYIRQPSPKPLVSLSPLMTQDFRAPGPNEDADQTLTGIRNILPQVTHPSAGRKEPNLDQKKILAPLKQRQQQQASGSTSLVKQQQQQQASGSSNLAKLSPRTLGLLQRLCRAYGLCNQPETVNQLTGPEAGHPSKG